MINRLISIALILTASVGLSAYRLQQMKSSETLRWDLSYTSVLERNKVGRDEFIWKWLVQHAGSPVENLLQQWHGEPITSSILMEKPGFRVGERVTLWLARTQGKVYLKAFVDGKPSTPLGYEIRLKLYDDTFKKITALRQSEPLRRKRTARGEVSGYAGFLSLYDRGESRQMLLTLEDFYSAGELKAGKFREELGGGRLRKIFEPLLSPHAEDDENGLFCPADEEQGETKTQTSADPATIVDSKDKKGCTALMRASENGNVQAVRELLKAGADVNGKLGHLSSDGLTGVSPTDTRLFPGISALMLAAKEGQLEIVKMLLAAGADPNAKLVSYRFGFETPLTFAIDPCTKNRFAIMDAMIAAGAEINPRWGGIPLIYAVSKRDKIMINALIARGADINLADANGTTPLMEAVLGSSPEMLRFLLAAGADVNARDKKGEDALAIAKQLKKDFPNNPWQDEIIRLLTNPARRTHKRKIRNH